MQPTPTPFHPDDPRALPSHAAERIYLADAPDTLLMRLTEGLLYLAGAVIILVTGLIGSYLAAGYDFLARLLLAIRVFANSSATPQAPAVTPAAVTIPGGWAPILIGLLIGLLGGLFISLPIFARAQMLALQMRIEENTRLTKELLYFLVTKPISAK